MDDITTCNFHEGIINASTGHVDRAKFQILTAPYSRAAQGKHLYLDWNPEAQRLVTTVAVDPMSRAYLAPTEFFIGVAGVNASVTCRNGQNQDVPYEMSLDLLSKLLFVHVRDVKKPTNVTITVQITFGSADVGGYGKGAAAAARTYWQGDEGYENHLAKAYRHMVQKARIHNGGPSVESAALHLPPKVQATEIGVAKMEPADAQQNAVVPLVRNSHSDEEAAESELSRSLWQGLEHSAERVADEQLLQDEPDEANMYEVASVQDHATAPAPETSFEGVELNQAAQSMLPLYEFVEKMTKEGDAQVTEEEKDE